MIITVHKPPETNVRVIKEVLGPEVTQAGDLDAPHYKPEHHIVGAIELCEASDLNIRLILSSTERCQKTKLPLIDVDQTITVRTTNTLGAIRCMQSEWTTAVWT